MGVFLGLGVKHVWEENKVSRDKLDKEKPHI